MNDGLKQRLIGAVVLLALAVIFVPVIFDRQKLAPIDRQTQIPEAPEITIVDIPEPTVPEVEDPAPPVEEIFLPEEEADAREVAEVPVAETPQLNEQGVPQAWVIQVASFRSAERAEELKAALAGAGHTAYTRAVHAGQGTMTRVFVGPKVDKSRLLKDQVAIEDAFKLSTVVLKFEP